MNKPSQINDDSLRYDFFDNGEMFESKCDQRLPLMGWNSWNAFGSGNNETLTLAMAEKIKELGLDELGYKYIILDDGCYENVRIDDRLCNSKERFPGGFKPLADKLHSMGLKFGMYNDIGDRLCSGAQVGLYGHEEIDAQSYAQWDIDFIKVDNCYYLWDNATFADPTNAKYSFAPNIRSIKIDGNEYNAVTDGTVTGLIGKKTDSYVTFIGTFDGTAPDHTPVGNRSSELIFNIDSDCDKICELMVEYASGKEEGIGQWLQVAVGNKIFFDDMLEETSQPTEFVYSSIIKIELKKGSNNLRLMNHRRQENTLSSYVRFKNALSKYIPDREIVLSVCEWGKTQPQNWAYKVGNYWRILNDITFAIGSPEGDYGTCSWEADYTTSITSQYNKAVIMDEFSGPEKGWNDPDMLVIGMNGLTYAMNKSHMAMWCMMCSPLMLGLDMRRVEKGDDIYNLIANKELISIDQDELGVQAKRIFTTYKCDEPDKEYIRDNKRTDVLCKPLNDGSIALSFFNIDKDEASKKVTIDVALIMKNLSHKMVDPDKFANAKSYEIKDCFTGEKCILNDKEFTVENIAPCDSIVWKVKPL